MKKILFILMLLVLPISIKALSASSYIAMDLETGRILYENNINTQHLIASTTKIMTAIVVIENSDIDKKITVGKEVLEAYGSAIYIEVGEELTIKDLLYGLMLRSGNDAAIVLAKNVAGSMENFAALMNSTAEKIGLKNTYFYNAHGLEEEDGSGNLSTSLDMAKLTQYAMQNATFREIFKTKKYTVKTNYKTYSWTNKNRLLQSLDYITGGKTGYTKKAHRTLVTTASKNNINIVVVTLNDPNDFQDHKTIYEDIFKRFEAVKVIDKNNFKIKNETKYKNDTLYVTEDIYVPVLKKERKSLSIKYELINPKKYMDGDIVGTAKIYLKDQLLDEIPIYVALEKKEKTSWWQKILRWFKKW